MPSVNSKGAVIHWEQAGSGSPVLLIMGLSFTRAMWYRLSPYLTPHYRLISFDNRGVGQSSIPPGPYSMASMADDAAAVMTAAGVEQAHVVGASMGGMIAQELYFRHTHRVRTLALGCTSASGVFSRWPHFKHAPRPSLKRPLDRVARERSLRHLLYAAGTPEHLIEEDIQMRCESPWVAAGVLSQLTAILLWSSFRRLPSIRVPTLVLHGEEDHVLPPENGRILAARIPNARLVILPGAGHVLTTDQPAATAEHLLAFLREYD